MSDSNNNISDYQLNQNPICTDNGLADIISWLKNGDYVVIHDNYKYGRYFHSKCPDDYSDDYINNHRIIYVNVSYMPGLLDDGEWEWYIKSENNSECTCELKSRMIDPNDLKYSYFLSY